MGTIINLRSVIIRITIVVTLTITTLILVYYGMVYGRIDQDKSSKLGQYHLGKNKTILYYVYSPDIGGRYDKFSTILLTGAIHGDEKIGYHILQRLVDELNSGDIQLKHNLIIFPKLNPRGFLANTRYNENGVDLNRDFKSSSSSTLSREQFSIDMIEFITTTPFDYSINLHSGARCVCYPPDSISPESIGDELRVAMLESKQTAELYLKHNRDLYQNPTVFPETHGLTNGYEWYPALGTLDECIFERKRIPTICVELEESKSALDPDTIELRYRGLIEFIKNL